MKPPEEIKKGLAACSADECHGQHDGCTYQDQFFCTMRMCGDALAYIQQLESRLAQVERERDAAVHDLDYALREVPRLNIDCYFCKSKDKPQCDECFWEWRGVCAENTEEG